ncbi:MAG: hypothetical protein HYT93_03720 [Parcubacteria group bacterium]|nr:hypothetical protein [Parcubacteria group bacterium]
MGRRRQKRRGGRKNKKGARALGILGRMGNEIGEAGEERALKACKNVSMPEWWRGIRRATYDEDTIDKKDLVISTDAGDVFIQIKSSLHKKHDYCGEERTSTNVPIVHVNLKESDEEIRKKILDTVSKERHELINKKK